MDQEFSDEDKNKMLLWCDRHCCLCDKSCGTDIEIHHITSKSKKGIGTLENGIPLCYDCHSKVHKAPDSMGQKIKPRELKARRDQIYEKYTRHLVPPIHYEVKRCVNLENKDDPSKAKFIVTHRGDCLAVPVLFQIEVFSDGTSVGLAETENGLYSGKNYMNLNPRHIFEGWFPIPKWGQEVDLKNRIVVNVKNVTIRDQFERPHKLLPVSWVRNKNTFNWYFEPGEKFLF